MAIIVHSPYDGQPVKVRDQDLERALRDGENRIFYAVKRSDETGYYGALTRKGSDKDEQRYIDMLNKMETARETGKARSAEQLHDATGKSRGQGPLRWIILLIVAGVIAGTTWYLLNKNKLPGVQEVLPVPDQDESTGQPSSRVEREAVLASTEDHTRHAEPLDTSGYITMASGLRYKTQSYGSGDHAKAGSYVLVNYTGFKADGTAFDASAPDKPVGFLLWSGDVPRGWDEGVLGMSVGERRRLILTPELMCGPYPGDIVLPDGTLVFEVELVGILPGIRLTKQAPGDGRIARQGDTVEVHYRAYVGRESHAYDDTYDRGGPIQMSIRTGEVIPGWELGVAGMTEGEKRLIEIPPYLAYGQRGAAGVIPPGASLRFEVELVHIKHSSARIGGGLRQSGG